MATFRHAFCVVLFVFVCRIHAADGAKILAIAATDSGSHLMSMLKFLNGLDSNGHRVFIVDFANVTKRLPPPPNTTVFHIVPPATPTATLDPKEGPGKQWYQIYSSDKLMRMYEEDDQKFAGIIADYADILDALMEQEWDLVVADDLRAPAAYAMAIRLKEDQRTPFLLYSTMGQLVAAEEEQLALERRLPQSSFAR
ncbi:hypothetical protein M3Y99_00745100 [Aphelenchoides fujianensis]|nr:hypothetical protein M3Y99_00745100 [Aphelenchoides fujianensis]